VSRSYTEEQRADAVGIFRDHGSREASRRTGIPETTVRRWAARAGVTSQATERTQAAVEASRAKAELRREQVKASLLDRIERVLDRMVERTTERRRISGVEVEVDLGEPTPTGMRELAVTLGILIDKLRLERGEVTGRTSSTSDVTLHHRSAEELHRDLGRILRVLPDDSLASMGLKRTRLSQ
jgi:hypothetical protein